MTKLQKLKGILNTSWNRGTKKIWLITKYGSGRNVGYVAHSVVMDSSMSSRFQSYLEAQIEQIESVSDYETITIDQDNNVLSKPSSETDFEKILIKINMGSDLDSLQSLDEIPSVWAYAVEYTVRDERLILLNKLKAPWSAARQGKYFSALFNNGEFSIVEGNEVLQFHNSIDVVYHEEMLYIFNKKNFEICLNLFEKLDAEKDDTLIAMDRAGVIHNLSDIQVLLMTKYQLRKISQLNKRAYFNDPTFISKLQLANNQEGWNLVFINGKLKITEDNIETVLSVLNNDRVKSLINDEKFDVEIKKPY